jgi:hypothetical protein
VAFAAAFAAVALALGRVHAYLLVEDYLKGRGGSLSNIANADNLDRDLGLLYLACVVATAVLIIVWTYQARKNAELICSAQHRRARGWAIGGWFCPVVSFWFPPMIVEDIYRASMPSTRHDQVSFDGMPGVPLIRWWWSPFLLAGIITYLTSRNTQTLDGLHTMAVGFVFSALFTLAAAVPLMMIIRQVSAWQMEPKTS